MTLAASVFAFAACAYAAMRLGALSCRDVVPFADGPATGTPHLPSFVGAAGVVGGALVLRHASVLELVISAMLIAALAACCYCDIGWGIVPDEFTLAPLVAILALSFFARNVAPLLSSIVVAAPFACVALVSKGRGLGWGDVKLAALIGSVLGMQMTIVALSAACFVAAASAAIRRKRSEPIAFAPYLAGSAAIALALPLTMR